MKKIDTNLQVSSHCTNGKMLKYFLIKLSFWYSVKIIGI